MPSLLDGVRIGGGDAPSRALFGPHETNLCAGRAPSERLVAYYRERAAGGAGVIVTETASVHPSDWPYERAPLAADCEAGWRAIAEACRPHGTRVLAGLGHAGAEGSSAYSQSVLWAPSPVADAVSREMPATMEPEEIDAVVAGFAAAARSARAAGLDGVELDAGVRSLLRQFHSGLTNRRADGYGADRLLLTRAAVAAVRRELGPDRVLALRLSCDELAPWGGVTSEEAAAQVAELAGDVDLLVVVRGGPYSAAAYRPDRHAPQGFNAELCATMRAAAGGRALVALQGSVVDAGLAQRALDDGVCDLVEMTRAQIADPRLVARLRADAGARVRPCILCNQACQVRDPRNPVVSCVVEPRSGFETQEPEEGEADAGHGEVLVVGAGPAGLECARVLAGRGHAVRVADLAAVAGGAIAVAGAALGWERLTAFVRWLEDECRGLGVHFELGERVGPEEVRSALDAGAEVVLATGSRPAKREGAVDALTLLAGGVERLPSGPVVVDDPVGGPVGVAVAEWLAAAGREVTIVSQDQLVGTLLARTGDLADANVRLQRAGVTRELRARLRAAGSGTAVLEDVWTGERREIPCAALVDCGPRLPEDSLHDAAPSARRVGDCVAPRTVLEAVLEGRRAALEVGAGAVPVAAGAGSAR